MPELPELENYKRTLAKLLLGEEVKQCRTFLPSNVSASLPPLIDNAKDSVLRNIMRYGKEIFFEIDSFLLSVHLMLSGEFSLSTTAPKYAVFALDFCSGNSLYVCDFNKLAKVSVCTQLNEEVPDALSPAFTQQYLAWGLHNRRKTIKAMLQEQSFVKGIGNAYADEILWEAAIHPLSICNKLGELQICSLYEAINKVLTDAIATIAQRGDVIRGEDRSFLAVHNPKRKLAPDGLPIKVLTGSLRAYYTDRQILYI